MIPSSRSIRVLAAPETQRRALLRRVLARLANIAIGDVDGACLGIEGARPALGALGRPRAVLVATSGTCRAVSTLLGVGILPYGTLLRFDYTFRGTK